MLGKNNNNLNEKIKFQEFILIDENGSNLGLMTKEQGKNIGEEKNLDLMLVTDKPPTVKLINYNKYIFDLNKKIKKQKQQVVTIKEVVLTIRIANHDKMIKIRAIEEHLKKGYKVQITVKLIKRKEKEKIKEAIDLLKDIITILDNIIVIERTFNLEKKVTNILVSANKKCTS